MYCIAGDNNKKNQNLPLFGDYLKNELIPVC